MKSPPKVTNVEEPYIKETVQQQHVEKIDNSNDFELNEKKYKKELYEREHQMKIRELELKMSKMESEYAPKEIKPKEDILPQKEESQYVFRNRIGRKFI